MSKSYASLLSLCCVMGAQTARADIFRCVNAEGKQITSDRPIPECQNRGTKVYKNNGTFKTEIAPPMSAEQKKKLAQEAERQRAEQIAEEERKKEERYLTAHYKSEADIEAARRRAVLALEEKRKLSQEQLLSLNQSFTRLQQELSNSKKSSSEYEQLRQRAQDLTQSVLNNQNSIAFYEAEIARINLEYDATLARYRLIVLANRRN